jgi:hypothetical protein
MIEWFRSMHVFFSDFTYTGRIGIRYHTFLYFLYSHTREYWMVYRGPGFLAVIWLLLTPLPLPPLPSATCLPVCYQSSLLTGEGGERVGKEPKHTTTRMPDPHSILSGARLSCGRIIWFFTPPLPPPVCASDTQEDWERETSCCWVRRGWGRSWIIRP